MKVLTGAQMRELDRRTTELGIPGVVLMENAGHRVVEYLARAFEPLSSQRIAILCGKGNNGGDGMVVARQLFTRFHPAALHVILFAEPQDLKGDAAANFRMLEACGCPVLHAIPAVARAATVVIDALLGTGISGSATGRMLEGIREINSHFPLAQVVAVDIPSGMPSDSGEPAGEFVRADCTVTFTAPKPAHVLPPNCDHVGELIVGAIGSPPSLYESDADVYLSLVEPEMFADLLEPRDPAGHKGTYGHVLVVAGSRGKTGAAAMSGLGALRAGAGLVTVASAASAVPVIASHAPELMTAPLAENDSGTIACNVDLRALAEGKTVIAMGPGMGRNSDVDSIIEFAVKGCSQPLVLDADALAWPGLQSSWKRRPAPLILTPHPGEMSRLTGKSTAVIQRDRVGAARDFAQAHGVTVVLKGQRTVLAFPDGRVWVNPTGTPAMGTGGSGDVLTGLIAGFLAQFPRDYEYALAGAVYLHGLAGEIGARALGEKFLIATDLLDYLPDAMEECAQVPDGD